MFTGKKVGGTVFAGVKCNEKRRKGKSRCVSGISIPMKYRCETHNKHKWG